MRRLAGGAREGEHAAVAETAAVRSKKLYFEGTSGALSCAGVFASTGAKRRGARL